MTSLKLKLNDNFYFEDIIIFGLNSELPAHRLCYFLNENLKMQLKRAPVDKEGLYKLQSLSYPQYFWEDKWHEIQWTLVKNKCPLITRNTSSDLFGQEVETIIPLIPKYKKVDYFLYYEGDPSIQTEKKIIENLKKVPQIRSLEKIDPLKTPKIQNLI